MAEPEHAQEHGEHLPGDGDGDQQKGREAREGIEDKQLAYCTASCETDDVLQCLWMARQEADGGGQLSLSRRWDRKREHGVQSAAGRDVRHDQKIHGGEGGREHVLSDHHLRPGEAGVDLRRGEDVVLRCVCKAVKEEVD